MGPLGWPTIKHGNSGKPSTYTYNGWIGEQADPWGDRLSSRERRSLNCRKNGEKSSGWAAQMAKQLKTGTLKSHPPTIIMVG